MSTTPPLRIVTCYGCERTFPRAAAYPMDDGRDGCPKCGTRVDTSLSNPPRAGDRVAGVIGS